jgi:hypothetical protein
MSAATATTLRPRAMFAAALVVGLAYMPLSIPSLIALEVPEWLCAALRHRPPVPQAGVIPVVDVAIEASRSVEPRAGANEETAIEPIRSIVAIRGAAIRGIVVISIRTSRRDANPHRDLSRRRNDTTKKCGT